ncbi:uncharacterized protein LOC144119535 [Amblyomma americanum]
MCVLGGICGFHTGGNKRALRVVLLAAEVKDTPVNAVTWAAMTFPGAALALFTCSAVIWMLYLKPHEPEPMSPQNLAVIKAAEMGGASRRNHRGVKYAGVAYAAIFSLTYAPSLLLGMDHRVALLSALASMTLATSLLTSCLRVAFDFIRNVWQTVPWGAVLLLGATHVASSLLQTYDVPHEVFKAASSAFWHRRSSLEVQAMLAVVTSLLAETTDKQVLVEMMAPVVAHIADMKRMHLTYLATPVIVCASSGVIMPTSAPLALLHDMAHVSFWRLFIIGLIAKIVVVVMVIMTVNAAGKVGLLDAHTTPRE